MSSPTPGSSSDQNSHSNPIPINSTPHNRTRSWSVSESSDSDSVPPLSPSQSPASATSVNIQTPFSSSTGIPPSSVSPSSPILSYCYGGSASKSPFGRATVSNPTFEDDESKESPPIAASAHRRMSTSWIPVRFSQQQQNTPAMESHQERGAGLLRRLSISSSLTTKPSASAQPRSITPLKQDGGTPPNPNPGSRDPGQHRKPATLSAGTLDTNNKPRAPSPMGERMLKGHYDGF